jgi:hypothetical protein
LKPPSKRFDYVIILSIVIFLLFAAIPVLRGYILDYAVEFTAGMLGVFSAFSLNRLVDWQKDQEIKKDVLRDIHYELVETQKKLGHWVPLLYTYVWDSVVVSGQIRLLNSEQIEKLIRVYKLIKETHFESQRIREIEHLAYSVPKNQNLIQAHNVQIASVRDMIKKVLKEDWWKNKKL